MKKLLLLASVAVLGGCSIYTCSGKFDATETHLQTTYDAVYAARSSGKITKEKAGEYTEKVYLAHEKNTVAGRACSSDEDAADDANEAAEEILDAIDDELETMED